MFSTTNDQRERVLVALSAVMYLIKSNETAEQKQAFLQQITEIDPSMTILISMMMENLK